MAGSNKGALASALSVVNPLETLRSTARGFAQEAKKQAIDQGIKKIPTDALKSIGLKEQDVPTSGEMKRGQEVNLPVKKTEKKVAPDILGGIDYRREVVHGVQMRRSREQQEIDQQLKEIMNELKRLVSSTQILSNEYATISVDSGPTKSGTYHVNFFSFMLSVIRTARQKVEDSGAWMAVSKRKNGYQEKAQSLGTKFTLSSERSTATQTG